MIKRILIGMLILSTGLLIGATPTPNIQKSNDTLSKTQIYNDFKSVYNEDFKAIIKSGVDVSKWAVARVDTIATKGVRIISNAAVHTYEILKTQQLVKSIHHTFYWLLSIILLIIISVRSSKYFKDPTETRGAILLVLGIIDVFLFVYNGMNFMELWTGFINPEYGAIKEIIEFTNK